MKKLLILFAFLVGCASIPKQVMNSIVVVDSSSGVVIHSDSKTTLVLTAYHVVHAEYMKHVICAAFESNCGFDTLVSVIYAEHYPVNHTDIKYFIVKNMVVNTHNDLALLEIDTDEVFGASVVAVNEPELGDEIWVGSNPNHVFRSLKKGIIGSVDRLDRVGNFVYEISGGVIYGSSGGGVFNTSGHLIGLVDSIDGWKTNLCRKDKLSLTGEDCLMIPLTDIAYAIPLPIIKDFLLSGKYSKYFKYLE